MKNEDNLPTLPNKNYEKFFAKFGEIDNLNLTEWRTAHLLGYFCRKYKDHYKIDYGWKFNTTAPSKCFEVWQMSVVSSKLSTDPKILKDYIDWVFVNKVPQAKKRLRSVSFLAKDIFINEYKIKCIFNKGENNISRSTKLEDKYKNEFSNIGYDLETYGDLAFAYQMNPMPEIVQQAFDKIVELGFDIKCLNKIV